MGKAPAVIIIARHGARLDAEDKTWHINSPTPYDPPLSYGGWTQTRALGARIGSLLHARDITLSQNEGRPKRRGSESAATQEYLRPLRRRHRVIFHSSPFLRCLQSSLAISAGMAQYEGNLAKFEAQHFGTPTEPPHGPTRASTLDDKSFPTQRKQGLGHRTASNPFPAAEPLIESAFTKPMLRVDAFLGEWLSADYFESITPPPSSNMMVAGAKADLLRPATPILGSSQAKLFPRPEATGWNGHSSSDVNSSISVSELIDSLPESSDLTLSDNQSKIRSYSEASITSKHGLGNDQSFGYSPPTPEYAISTNEAIPRGYVADARDACTNIDFQWDSMHEPQLWGDGGEYSEEWSSMHRRFRKGIMDMISWYKANGTDKDSQSAKEQVSDDYIKAEIEEDSDEEDVVLIIVTHGAGCNALIGALTNQPVLLDVGMASLTMAVRKEKAQLLAESQRRRPSTGSGRRRSSSIDTSQSEEYDVKLTASTEHLRAGTNPLEIPQLQPMAAMMPSIPEVSDSNSFETSTAHGNGSPIARNSALGSIRKARAATLMGRTLSGNLLSASPTDSSPPTGLWGGGSQGNGAAGRRNSINHRGQFQHKTLTFEFGGTNQNSDDLTDLSSKQLGESTTVRVGSSATGSTTEPTPTRSNTRHGGLWNGHIGARQEPRRRWTFADNS